jgi:hypothetical protein
VVTMDRLLDVTRRAVAQAHPDHFRWGPDTNALWWKSSSFDTMTNP